MHIYAIVHVYVYRVTVHLQHVYPCEECMYMYITQAYKEYQIRLSDILPRYYTSIIHLLEVISLHKSTFQFFKPRLNDTLVFTIGEGSPPSRLPAVWSLLPHSTLQDIFTNSANDGRGWDPGKQAVFATKHPEIGHIFACVETGQQKYWLKPRLQAKNGKETELVHLKFN